MCYGTVSYKSGLEFPADEGLVSRYSPRPSSQPSAYTVRFASLALKRVLLVLEMLVSVVIARMGAMAANVSRSRLAPRNALIRRENVRFVLGHHGLVH